MAVVVLFSFFFIFLNTFQCLLAAIEMSVIERS